MIRRARVKDAPSVHAVMLTARDDIPLADNFAEDVHKKKVRDLCRDKRVWIDERSNELAGVMVMSVIEVEYLVTAESYRHQGVASGLIDCAIVTVRRLYKCGIEARTRDENRPTVRLLLKKGFRVHPFKSSPAKGWTIYVLGKVD